MALHVSDRLLRWALVVFLVLAVAWGVWRLEQAEQRAEFLMGEVVLHNEDGSYQVRVRGGEEMVVVVGTSTPIFEGRRAFGRSLQTGEHVMIEGVETAPGVFEARTIRVLSNDGR